MSSSTSLSSSTPTTMLLLFLLICTHAVTTTTAEFDNDGHLVSGCGGFTRMFSFGDSITDAGNLATVNPTGTFNMFPYGETFFGHPTGRFCDGRLIVDFIADGLGLPFLTPFLRGKTAEDFRQGANFAVAGATALSQDFFKEMGLDLTIIPPFSLDVQLEWFKGVLQSLASTDKERKEIMSKSLFLMGEVGGNDYNHPFFQNRSFTIEIKPLVPKVIAKIENAIKVLIDLGAKTIVVPGNFPIGCIPRYLAMFQSKSSPKDYDEFGCIKWLNDFSEYHNNALKHMLHQIPRDPTVNILYGDYYNTALKITHHPIKHGFKKETVLVACCGDAEALRLPYLTAFLRGNRTAAAAEEFRQGANFAVSASTALRQDFFRERGLDMTIIPPYSLEVQMVWFKQVLHLLGSTDQECKDIMARSLFLMGEIGINDYNHHLFQNRSFTVEIKPLVPKVISKIADAIKVLIDLGAKTVVVPGIPPMGCLPRFLNMYPGKNHGDYDKFGCLKWLNNFSKYHNRELKRMLRGIIPPDPTHTLVYGDYYGAMLRIVRSPMNKGFTKESVLTACCGAGGPYNANSLVCNATSNLCPEPSRYISWDGLHLTEAAYRSMAEGLLHGPYAQPAIPSRCTSR
uniref:Uncharacterized protein n=1 Tax=Leersia perrieri TaxID=77586 RepID=A0A0D9VUB5_9ORYZ